MKGKASEKLMRSNYLQVVKRGHQAIIYHSLFGFPLIVSLPTLKLLDIFRAPRSREEVEKEYEIENLNEIVTTLCQEYILVPFTLNERELLKAKVREYKQGSNSGQLIDYLSLIMAEICNFRCSYCFASNILDLTEYKNKSDKMMSFETAKRAISVFLEILQRNSKRKAKVNFGGGEPLLNFRTIKQILQYYSEELSKDFNLSFNINTNASFVTKEIASLLNSYKVEITTSLDGLKPANDAVRVFRSGKGTFETILRGWQELENFGNKINGFCTTINKRNFHLVGEDLIDFASQKGMREIRIDPDVIHVIEIPLEEIIEKLLHLKKYGKMKGVIITGFWERPIENLFNSILEERTAFCGGIRGNSFVVNPRGEIFMCGYSTKKLGSIFDFSIDNFFKEGNEYHQLISSRLVGEISKCINCSIEGQCVGGCYVAKEYEEKGNPGVVERNCELYQKMSEELLFEKLLEE